MDEGYLSDLLESAANPYVYEESQRLRAEAGTHGLAYKFAMGSQAPAGDFDRGVGGVLLPGSEGIVGERRG